MICDEYSLVFVDRVLDPVHGFIDITRVEQRIINLPIFRRMQSIKQLSMTNWVFPGAEHTRYIHSLGVMYIADQMAVHLGEFNDEQRQLLRLAGLLHDIGHYPLSHVTETVYRDRHRLTKYDGNLKAHNNGIYKKIEQIYVKSHKGSGLSDEKIPEYMESRYTDKMHHEAIGAALIREDQDIIQVINDECPFISIDDICDVIVGSVDRDPRLSLYVQIIHSELDADGIDYIMRDASFSGTSYGGFELGLLLRNLKVGVYNGTKILGVKPKGIPMVDQYLINKHFSYTQVIFNRHVAILDLMVEKITHALIELSQSNYPDVKALMMWIKKHYDIEDYLAFTDVFFWSQLNDKSIVEKAKAYFAKEYEKQIIDLLVHYSEPELVGECTITTGDRKKAKKCLTGSKIYDGIYNNDEDIFVLHTRGFTKEIPTSEYQKIIKGIWKNGKEDPLYIEMNTRRLQEGIAIIDENIEPKLLVDDCRSAMSTMWKNKTYILRRYRFSHKE